MSSNGANVCEDAEMAECDGEKVVTMMDVLKEQEDFEDDANAVLGASDDKNCTYSKGYIKRQAIYACMTCCIDVKTNPLKWAGVCLACSLACHENHELIELYTKRNFRCDCGNPKFNSHPCQFTSIKSDLNIENNYNQNFSGVYCICHRPYPDPEAKTEEEMIQCIICEDWLHSNHLDAEVPSHEQYSEMICKMCMDKNEFLHDYGDLTVNKESVDVEILNNSLEGIAANCNERPNSVTPDNIEKSNSDDIVDEETKNNTVVEKNSNEDKTNDLEKCNPKSVVTEKQDIVNEKEVVIDTLHNESNMSELENDKKTETEQQSDTEKTIMSTSAEAIQETNDNPAENQISQIEPTLIPETKATDSRTQEQLEEDFLLADPVESDSSNNKDITHTAPASEIQTDVGDKSVNEKNSEPEEMEVSESIGEDQVDKIKNKPGNVLITEQTESTDNIPESESVATEEGSEIVAATEKIRNVKTIEQDEGELITEQVKDVSTDISENVQDDSTANSEHSKVVSTAKQSENIAIDEPSNNTPTSEQPVPIPTISENEANNESESVPTIDSHNNFNTNVSLIENNTVSMENNSLKESNSMDAVVDGNNTDNIKNNDIEFTSNNDNEVSDKQDTDILKRKLSDGNVDDIEVKKAKLEETKCVRPKGVKRVHHGATFWPSNFRHKLCTCNVCVLMYKDLSVLFLIDPDDTVTAYERLGKEKSDGKPASQYEKGMEALSSLGRVQQINALTEYSKLRDKLLDFLKTFKDKKVIVKEEDIKAFFAGMKPVREPDGVYFCR